MFCLQGHQCGATNDKQFKTLVTLLGRPDMAEDDRFRSNGDRVTNREQLFPALNDLFAARTTEEWVQVFDGSGMPYAP